MAQADSQSEVYRLLSMRGTVIGITLEVLVLLILTMVFQLTL